MKKQILSTLVLLFMNIGCMTPTYSSSKINLMKSDKLLFIQKDKDGWLKEPLKIFRANIEIGNISLINQRNKNVSLKFSPIKGKQQTLWRQYDYSGITKITQSADEKIIRVYHWYILLVSRLYVTELNLETRKVRGYRLPYEEQYQ